MDTKDIRTLWVSTCVFWGWTWTLGALAWTPFTLGFSLLALLPAAAAFFCAWIPIGKPPVVQQPQLPWYPALPPVNPPGYGYPQQ